MYQTKVLFVEKGENISTSLNQQVRCLYKLVGLLVKGKKTDKILRTLQYKQVSIIS
ncbi:DUF2200 family protein [Ochrovirga pacifica]|uniref:DUF2200 family protein n=1 Tax=Ochrovirga pacifica TaxID=1042376 RepID=UPI001111EE06